MKRWKRFLASVCAAVCAAGFSLPAFAADSSATWNEGVLKAMSYIEGSDGEYLFSPPDEIFDDNSRSIWQQIKEDFNDDSRVVLVGFYFPSVGDRLSIVFQSHDKATLKFEKSSTSSNLSYSYNSSDGLFCRFSNSPSQEGISVVQAYAFSNNKQVLTEMFSSNPRQPMMWANQTDIELLPSSDVAFASDIKNIVFEAPPTPAKHILTIQYQYEDGSQAAEPVVKTYEAGAAYQVVSPVIGGFYTDQAIVSGTMPDKDLTITVTYLPVPGELLYTLSVVYQFSDGTPASDIVIKHLEAGTPYSIVSPVITGYTADKPTVSGTMPENDLRIVVTYSKDSGTEGGGGIPGEFPDIGGHIDWHDPFEWFDTASGVDWHDPFAWG